MRPAFFIPATLALHSVSHTHCQMKHTAGSMSSLLEQLLASHVDFEMLREIASADYGDDVNDHLSALSSAIAGTFVVPLSWTPIEVLELVRSSTPADRIANGELVRKSVREHWKRLFCCTVLLKTSSQPENLNILPDEDSTIERFAESAIALGDNTTIAAIEFLERLMQTSHAGCPFCPVALVTLESSLKGEP